MNNNNQMSIKCQYDWQVTELEQVYRGDTRLVAWPYSINIGVYVISITTYGEYCKVKE